MMSRNDAIVTTIAVFAVLGLLAIATGALGDELITSGGDYIQVPEGKRAVFIKDTLPTEHCIVTCIAPVMEPVVPVEEREKDGVCEREVVISPNLPDPDCPVYCDEVEDELAVSPSFCVER